MNEINQGVAVRETMDLKNEDWYNSLVDDCLAIKVEREFEARETILRSKWEIGERIFQENQRMERKEIYGERIIENLSIDIGRSKTDLWNCVKFYKAYPEEDFVEVQGKLPGGKETSWYKMTLLLGERNAPPKKEKQSYKVDAILQAVKAWVVSKGAEKDEDISKALEEFREFLLQTK